MSVNDYDDLQVQWDSSGFYSTTFDLTGILQDLKGSVKVRMNEQPSFPLGVDYHIHSDGSFDLPIQYDRKVLWSSI